MAFGGEKTSQLSASLDSRMSVKEVNLYPNEPCMLYLHTIKIIQNVGKYTLHG